MAKTTQKIPYWPGTTISKGCRIEFYRDLWHLSEQNNALRVPDEPHQWFSSEQIFHPMNLQRQLEMSIPSRAVVLVSGGLDSATVLAIAHSQGFSIHAISFDYGQRHRFELEAADKVCQSIGVIDHVICRVDTNVFRGSALTNDIPVPHNRNETEMSHGIPVTYVPARNTIFLSIALGLAESIGANDLFIGVNSVDYSGYPDCRPEFISAFQTMANLATKAGVEGQHLTVHTPLISLTKAEIIRRGLNLGVNYRLTHSCYDPDPNGVSCGECDSCQLRLKGFREAGAVDPIRYQ